MEDKVVIAKRVALELRDGNLVNLGIGLPTMVPQYLPPEMEVYFQSENGIIGMAQVPGQGMEDPSLTDAGGGYVGAIPGAASIDSALSFGLIRGGHLDITVLGGLEVNEAGQLANWIVPGKMVPGMGGAMDLVTRRQTRDRRHDPHRQGQAENPEEMHSAADLGTPGQSHRHRVGGD